MSRCGKQYKVGYKRKLSPEALLGLRAPVFLNCIQFAENAVPLGDEVGTCLLKLSH